MYRVNMSFLEITDICLFLVGLYVAGKTYDNIHLPILLAYMKDQKQHKLIYYAKTTLLLVATFGVLIGIFYGRSQTYDKITYTLEEASSNVEYLERQNK